MFDVKRFDVYRKLPKDLTQPTTTGAVISIISTCFILFLLISEALAFAQEELISELYVDDPTLGEKIPVRIKIDLPNMECKFLGIDIQDNQGRHEVGYMENTVRENINEKKGCSFGGQFNVNKVPGNFHISTHSVSTKPTNYDFNHQIKELYFGDPLSGVRLPGVQTNLAGTKRIKAPTASHDYTLKIVPTVYQDKARNTKFGYQYTALYKEFTNARGSPAIWFRYEISPITVKYTQRRKPIYHFVTTVLAIIGGTFTVAGMLDSMIYSAHQMVQKAEIGKLG